VYDTLQRKYLQIACLSGTVCADIVTFYNAKEKCNVLCLMFTVERLTFIAKFFTILDVMSRNGHKNEEKRMQNLKKI
jgi:hypothetical protein